MHVWLHMVLSYVWERKGLSIMYGRTNMEDWHAGVQARRIERMQRRKERIEYEQTLPQRIIINAFGMILFLFFAWLGMVLFLV